MSPIGTAYKGLPTHVWVDCGGTVTQSTTDQ